MEFGLSEALPIYSGGLGNVAGDQLKAANDLGVPVVGVGLLYQQGYFRQFIDADGNQTALYPYNDPGQLQITAVRDAEGEWLRLAINLPGDKLWLRAWQAQVGRVRLYLLDSNDPANSPVYRGMTSELYGGGPEMRLQQELILGIGGWRLLQELGIKPEVCHLNEGHAAFAVFERARDFMADSGQPFAVALAVTRAGNLFTTHTPVPAGFDAFAPAMMRRYFRYYAENLLGIGIDDLMALGRKNPADSTEPFNMAYLAMRGSGAVNGVSRLHGEVSRGIFQDLFARWPRAEVPIGYVTNGVHTPTWDSLEADRIWTEACGPDRWRGTMESLGEPHPRSARLRVVEDALRQSRRIGRICAPAPAQGSGGPGQPESDLGAEYLRPQLPDDRLCAALCHLQTAQPAPARSRAVDPDSHRPAAVRCSLWSPARPIPKTRRGRRWSRSGCVSCSAPKCGLTRSSWPITTCCWPNTWSRALICGSTIRAGHGRHAAPAG